MRSTWCYRGDVKEIISQRELRNDSGSIMRGLDDGGSFIVTRHGVPVGELRPLRRQRLVDVRAVAEIFRDAPAIDRDRFAQDLDVLLDQDTEPRG
ncbi:MAG: hypothetical protein IPL37_10265 [Austwickia sp.]|nr:hypothetical protein [Austwickia sp.]